MDFLYSGSLLLALVAGGISVLLGGAAILRSRPVPRRAAVVSVTLALVSLLISVATHRYWGHGAASLEPMDNARFVLAHRSFVVAAVIVLTGLLSIVYASRLRRMD